MFGKFSKLLTIVSIIGYCSASDSDYSEESYGRSLSDRLLAAEHFIAINKAQEVQDLFTKNELETDVGVKYFVGLSKLITRSDIDTGAKLVTASAIQGYSDAINLIQFDCNMQVTSILSERIEEALKKLIW